jgi:hypothetical protein
VKGSPVASWVAPEGPRRHGPATALLAILLAGAPFAMAAAVARLEWWRSVVLALGLGGTAFAYLALSAHRAVGPHPVGAHSGRGSRITAGEEGRAGGNVPRPRAAVPDAA